MATAHEEKYHAIANYKEICQCLAIQNSDRGILYRPATRATMAKYLHQWLEFSDDESTNGRPKVSTKKLKSHYQHIPAGESEKIPVRIPHDCPDCPKAQQNRELSPTASNVAPRKKKWPDDYSTCESCNNMGPTNDICTRTTCLADGHRFSCNILGWCSNCGNDGKAGMFCQRSECQKQQERLKPPRHLYTVWNKMDTPNRKKITMESKS